MLVTDCPVNAIHPFQVRTLRSLGYRTRVALANKSHLRPEVRTDYHVDVSVYNNGRERTRVVENIGTLAAGARLSIDCTPYDVGTGDSVLVFHLVPDRYAGKSTVDISRDEVMSLVSIQDHYVEYFRDSGPAAGVLYQTGPFNHPKLSPKSTTLIQAPKFYASATIDSILSLLNASADEAYDRAARLAFTLAGPGIKISWSEELQPFVPRSISIRDLLVKHGVALGPSPTFVCLYGMAENATVIPLTIVAHDSGAIGIEHTLAPDYYSPTMMGARRHEMMKRLKASSLFGGRS